MLRKLLVIATLLAAVAATAQEAAATRHDEKPQAPRGALVPLR